MSPERQKVQNLDFEKLDDGKIGPPGRTRRSVRKRLRGLRFKGFGFKFEFNEHDETGSEEQ